MAEVLLENVSKTYPGNVVAVSDFNLKVADREFVVLVGPSGCGKSTTLRMVAGLEACTGGTMTIDGKVVNDVPPKDRNIAMVFQNYALYPHMSVYDNMAFGLKLRKVKRAEVRERVGRTARLLGIQDLLNRRPKALSGGQRQRVAVGRAIVRDPSVFLFDEPLSNLDAKMRVQMRTEISRLHAQLDATMMYVTHDQTEAMTMGDRIVVMKDGFIQQVATPLDLYDHPANLFVARFIGMPPMNSFPGRLEAGPEGLVFKGAALEVVLPEAWSGTLASRAGTEVIFGLRPEDIGSGQAVQTAGAPVLRAGVDLVEPMGAETLVHLTAGGQAFIARVDAHRPFAAGEQVDLPLYLPKAHLFDPADGRTLV